MNNPVSLVGRTNVGKSLLFNKLVKSKKSLVIDYHGVTRDINKGLLTSEGKSILIEDTGGFPEEKNSSSTQTLSKTLQSISNSSLVLFITSCEEGLTFKDIEISRKLRKFNKKVLLIINKCDLLSKKDNTNSFYELGFKDIFHISAKSNLGILKLQSKIFTMVESKKVKLGERKARISFVGKPNVGKSTLINTIVNQDRMVISGEPGTTLDSVEIEFNIKKNKYLLYDTAGLLRKSKTITTIQKFSISDTLKTIKNTDICLFIMSAEDGITKQDKAILNIIKRYNKPFFVVLNKIDKISQENLKLLKKEINYFLNIASNAHCVYVSALKKKNIRKILSTLAGVLNLIRKRYKASRLTQILDNAVNSHQPPRLNRNRPRLKFAQQSKFEELIIYIYGNGIENLPSSYQKYLSNYFIKELGLFGIPLNLRFSKKKNPLN